MPGTEIILALNSGSSSLKIGCYARSGERDNTEELVLTGSADSIGSESGSLQLQDGQGVTLLEQKHVSETQQEALERLAAAVHDHLPSEPVAIGHRVVHGGPRLLDHQRITPEVLQELKAAVHLAPLHIPQALALIEQTQRLYPRVPQYACFDTVFHRTMPPVAKHLALPLRLFEAGVRRYGFHGLSCESILHRLRPDVPSRVVIAHLGNGSSITAVRDGLSFDTTMGLSPTGGVPMGSRSGDLDPAVLLYLLRNGYPDADTVERFVNHQCGLAGLSGGETDMQRLLERENKGDASAALAVQAFCTAVRKAMGGYAALLEGVDLLVFTGGIGAHSEAVRGRIVQGLDRLFTASMSTCIRSLPAQEEEQMARICRGLTTSA